MSAPTVAELLVPMTEDEFIATEIGELAGAGFPTTTWTSLSVSTGLVRADCKALSALANDVPEVVKQGYARDVDDDDWADLLFESQYNITRKAAIFALRTLRVTDAGGAGPFVRTAGDLTVTMANGLKFTSTTGGTIPLSGYLDFTFRAEFSGADYNGSTSGWTLVTALPGVTVTDPGGTPTFTAQGADKESTESYKARGIARWPELGSSANDDVWKKWAIEGDATVTRSLVRRHYPLPGNVTLYIGGAAGAVSGGVVANVVAYITPREPNVVDSFVSSVVNHAVALTGTVYALAAELTAAKLAFETRLAALQKIWRVGGTVPRELLIEKILEPLSDDDRNDLTLTTPPADIALAFNEVPIFDVTGLTWTAV